MEVWQQIMDFTERNASKVQQNQWNLNYLEVIGTSFDCGPRLDDICKRIPKLRIETRTTYVKPRVESKLAANFRYTPPKRTTLARKPFTKKKVTVKVVVPKEDSSILQRNCFCTCKNTVTTAGAEASCNFDNDITLDKLLDIIKRYEQGTLHGNSICNIVGGFEGNISLKEDKVIQILMMLDSSDHMVQESTLLIIHRLSKVFINAKQFLLHGGLDDFIYLMLMGSTDQVQIQAARCIAKLTEREELATLWMQTMVISGTEALFDVLSSEEVTSEDLRNAVLKAISNIGSNQKMAARLLEFGLEKVVHLIFCENEKYEPRISPMSQRMVLQVLTNIVSHNISMAEQFLEKYNDAVEGVLRILQYAECPEQQEAARFLAAITLFKPSIDSIISYHATHHFIWAMTCSHCRIVREYSSKAFKNVALCNDKDKLLNALSQLSMPQGSQSDNDSHSTESMMEILSSSTEQNNMAKVINTVKSQISCTALEKVMVEVFSVASVCFQTDSLHLSGKTRTFRNGLGKAQRSNNNSTNESYLSSLRVLCNILIAMEKLICMKDAEEASSAETGGNLKLASLYVQCGGLQFIEQLAYLSTKLQTVNLPSFHSIDPTNLTPKELISTLKTSRTDLIFHHNKPQNKTLKDTDHFGFHQCEIQFLQQALSLLVVLGQAISPDYDPALEDLKVFSYRRQVIGRKRISFRTSALMVQSAVKMGKLSSNISGIEEKPVSSKRKSSSSSVRKSSQRSTTRTKSPDTTKNRPSKGEVTAPPLPAIEPGISSNCEMVQFVKQSILNSKVVSHLACWITCGVYDIQINVLKVLRYLMHIGEVRNQPTDTQTPGNEPQEAWTPKRSTAQPNQNVQRSPFVSSVVKSKNKLPYLGHLCVRHVIQYCGPYLLDLLKPPVKGGLGRMSLMVIQECVSNGEPDSRFKLVKLGSFAQIIECIRGTEDEADTQSLCLVVLRKLVSSDQSLKQLFFAHGGMSLVMALHEYQYGVVKEQAALTLAALSKGSTFAKTKGLSKKRHKKTSSADDIWDHVTHKWEGQDKVSKVLRKFNVRY